MCAPFTPSVRLTPDFDKLMRPNGVETRRLKRNGIYASSDEGRQSLCSSA